MPQSRTKDRLFGDFQIPSHKSCGGNFRFSWCSRDTKVEYYFFLHFSMAGYLSLAIVALLQNAALPFSPSAKIGLRTSSLLRSSNEYMNFLSNTHGSDSAAAGGQAFSGKGTVLLLDTFSPFVLQLRTLATPLTLHLNHRPLPPPAENSPRRVVLSMSSDLCFPSITPPYPILTWIC